MSEVGIEMNKNCLSEIDLRLLTESDRNSIESLWRNSTQLFKQGFIRNLASLDLFFQDSSFELYGCFEGPELVCTLGVRTWGALPYFSLVNLVSRSSGRGSLASAASISAILQTALEKMHRRGRFTFYIATLARAKQLSCFRQGLAIKHAKHFRCLENYDCTIEEVYSPGEASSFSVFSSLLGARSHSQTIWIRRYTLKAESRPKYFELYKK